MNSILSVSFWGRASWKIESAIDAAEEELKMGLAAMADNVKEMSNPISESGKLNIVKNLATATAGINEQGGIKIAITAKRAHFDQWVKVAMGHGLKKTEGNERS